MAVLAGALGGGVSFWLIQGNEAKKLAALKENALCVVRLPDGTASAAETFTTQQVVEMFHVGIQTQAADEALSISISGDQGVIANVTRTTAHLFGLGRNIPPGTYTVTLSQDADGKGGEVFIAAEQPVFVTGWQIWSRTYAGLLVLSGICVLLFRKSNSAGARAGSAAAFHSLLLGLVLIFVYLLFHESGHALAQLSFGRFDLAHSDFWGIHGHPHSGGAAGPPLEPWQQTAISFSGPMLPTLAGFGLFVLWSLPAVRRLRSARPMVNLYFSATVAGLVFSDAVCQPLSLLGFITAEGDLIGHVEEVGGPVWLFKILLWGVFLACAFILWRVLPEVFKSWKALFLQSWASVSPAPAA